MSKSELEKFREMSVAEFFAKYREVAGFSNPARALYQTVRELVENSLDATDGHGIAPEVRIYIERVDGDRGWCRVTVEDNGIGVPPTVMPEAFGKVLFSSKYVLRQTRGMYGLGVKASVLYGQVTTGNPVEVQSTTRGSSYIYAKKLYIDMKRNEPVVLEEAQFKKNVSWHGTRVSLIIECDWQRAKSRILEYIRRTAIIAPYADILIQTPDGEVLYFPRTTKKMPKPPKTAKPHPHGVDVETLKTMLKATKAKTLLEFLEVEFQSVGRQSALEFLKSIGLRPTMKPKQLLKGENGALVVAMVEAMRSFKFRAPRSDCLSPLGEELIKVGLKRMFNPEWVDAVTRPPRAYQGHPFIVEVGMAYGGSIQPSEEPLLLRYANKIPLLYEEREDVSYKVLSDVNWKQYDVEMPAPLVVLVHVVSTKVPYKGVGKESISDVPELEAEIRNGVLELARRLKRFIAAKEREAEVMRKILVLSKYIPEIARSLKVLSRDPGSWKPLEPGEERDIVDALVSLVAKNMELPRRGDDSGRSVEDLIRSIISEVRVS
ncbi:MAG: DNA topoisomerase VI subunit B [Acidilobaceae archaeon]